MFKPKITIVTITYNSERYLEQTITSVIEQTYTNREYIVVDGNSTDGTLDIIKKYESEIDNWISEPDNGIADAMNKGIDLATGDYILFLHSDDYLSSPSILADTVEALPSPHNIFLFDILFKNEGRITLCSPRGLTWWINFKTGVHHQAAFCSREYFKKIGAFDTTFEIAMDYDFFLRSYRAGVTSCKVNIPLSVMRLVGISSRHDWSSLRQRFSEEKRVHLKNCPNKLMGILYRLYWLLYLPYRKIRFFWSCMRAGRP